MKKKKQQGDPFDFPDLQELHPTGNITMEEQMQKIRKLAKQRAGWIGKQFDKKSEQE